MMNTIPQLEIIHGPMFSGKTTELLRKLDIYSGPKCKTLYINSKKDTRTNEDFSSHNKNTKMPKNTKSLKLKKLADIFNHKEYKECNVIGIDESQFFSDLVSIVLELVEKHNKRVIVAGLDSDFNRDTFGQISRLIQHADEIRKLYSYCTPCKNKNIYSRAIYSRCITENDEKSLVKVGGAESYIPVCRSCYLSNLI